MLKFWIFVNPNDGELEFQHDSGYRAVGFPGIHPADPLRPAASFDIIPDLPYGWGARVVLKKDGHSTINQKGRFFLRGGVGDTYPWSGDWQECDIAMDDFTLDKLPEPEPIPEPEPEPGAACINGKLLRPDILFFELMDAEIGQDASDWKIKIDKLFPAGNPPNVLPNYNNGYYGITQQRRSVGPRQDPDEGEPAGRLFLPTATRDDLNYYAKPVSFLTDKPGGGLMYEWRLLDGPPYVPGNC